MSSADRIAVVVLAVLLTVTLSAGNVVFAAHATVLDPGFTSSAIEEEGGNVAIADLLEDVVANVTAEGMDSPASFGDLVGTDEALEGAVDGEIVQSELEANVDRLYAYLHGNSDELNLSVDAEPIARGVNESVAAAVANSTTLELVEAMGGGGLSELPVDGSTLASLDEGPDGYAEARAEVREDVYDQVLEAAVGRALAERSKDELLALVISDYDGEDYSEAEKERLVAEREDEIWAALATEIERERGEELERRTDEELAATGAAATDEPVSTGRESVDEPATAFRDVTVAALTTDMTYDTYRERAESARTALGAGVGSLVEGDVLAEVGSRIDLNEQLDVPEEGAIRGQVGMVAWFDRLAIAVPLVALALIGGIWYVTRSIERTAGAVGWSLVWAGLPAVVLLWTVFSDPAALVGAGGGGNPVQAVMLGIVERAVNHLRIQSLVLALLGVVFVGAAYAVKRDLHERLASDP